MKKQYNVLFIRHNWDEKVLIEKNNDLISQKKFAFHFEVGGWDPAKYKGAGKTAIEKFLHLNDAPSLVVARYMVNGKKNSPILVGLSKANSKGLISFKAEGRQFELKTLEFEDCFVVKPEDFPTLFYILPPFGTMCDWKMGRNVVNEYYRFLKGEVSERGNGIDFLAPWQLEIVCEEYLRSKGYLMHKLLSTGKSMKHFDVIGVSPSGSKVFAQIKHKGTKAQYLKFIEATADHVGSAQLFYFDDKEKIETYPNIKNVQKISVQDVFDYFQNNNPGYLNDLVYGFQRAG